MRDAKIDIALLYLSDRRVAYSSLAFYMFKEYLEEKRTPHAVYFLEEGALAAEKPSPPPSKARVILVSLPYELMYLDLVKALDAAGIPVWAEDREKGPVIIAGGPAVTANPLPLYGIVDSFLIGEAEPVLEEIIEAARERSRARILELLAEAGLLVPGVRDRVRRIYERNLDKSWYPTRQLPPPGVEPVWGRAFMLETTRGCGRMCRFCMEGTIFRPKRDRSLSRLVELVDIGVERGRHRKVSFYSLAFFDSPYADTILEYVVDKGLEASVPSIRAETLTSERAELVARAGQRSITIAPETGSCRMGRAINKCIGKRGALEAIENAMEGGIRHVKLYVIVGFPGETDEDYEETISMVEEAALIVARRGGQLRVSVNPFMPKPVTAMQWAPLAPVRVLRERIRGVLKAAGKKGGRGSSYDPKWAVAQTLLARGDSQLARLVVEWARLGGSLGALRTAARKTRVRIEEYTGEKPLEWDPPWHRIIEHPYASLRHLRLEYKLYLDELGARTSL